MRTRCIAILLLLLFSRGLPAQPTSVDHGLYDALLRQHVSNGLVDYDAFARDSSFTRYLSAMEQVDPSLLSSDDRIAYWINVYNAWTIRLITMHNERESIRNINRTLGVLRLKGPWTVPFVRVRGRTLSLDQVQYEQIRRESSDPRIHFALSCGAMSCAPLRSEAYIGALLDVQLQDQGRVFLTTDSTRNRYDVKAQIFHRNAVFRYFLDDFGETRREHGAFLAQWYNDTTSVQVEKRLVRMMREQGDTARIQRIVGDSTQQYDVISMEKTLKGGTFRYADLPFDWSLNSQSRTTAARRK